MTKPLSPLEQALNLGLELAAENYKLSSRLDVAAEEIERLRDQLAVKTKIVGQDEIQDLMANNQRLLRLNLARGRRIHDLEVAGSFVLGTVSPETPCAREGSSFWSALAELRNVVFADEVSDSPVEAPSAVVDEPEGSTD